MGYSPVMVQESGKTAEISKNEGESSTSKANEVPKEGKKDENFESAFKLPRSPSLSRNGPDGARQRSPSPRPATSPKKSFRDRRAKFEKARELEDKYRNQRNVKALTKTKSNIRKSKASPEKPKETESLSDFMKEIRADLKEIKTDVKSNNSKRDKINTKIRKLEERADKTEIENGKKFEGINKEMKEMEINVTNNIIEHFKPRIREIESKAKEDLKKMLEEQINTREDAGDVEEESEKPEEERAGEPPKPKK